MEDEPPLLLGLFLWNSASNFSKWISLRSNEIFSRDRGFIRGLYTGILLFCFTFFSTMMRGFFFD